MNKDLIYSLMLMKHFLADFVWQTPYMLGKGKKGTAWIMPLSAHCAVHAGLSALIIAVFNPYMMWLAGVEFVAHFIVDRIKATYKLPEGAWPAEMKGKYLNKHYVALGADQLAHGLTYVAMIAMMS